MIIVEDAQDLWWKEHELSFFVNTAKKVMETLDNGSETNIT